VSEPARNVAPALRIQSLTLPFGPEFLEPPGQPADGEPSAARRRKPGGRKKPAAAEAAMPSLAVVAALEAASPVPIAVAAVASEPVACAAVAPAVRPQEGVLVFDVETTGTDRRRDQVIELCIQFGLDDGAPSRTWRFKPSVPISPGAQAVHGISMDDLADCPGFAVCADEIEAIFAEAKVIVGYNLMFDIDMVQAEYERLKRPLLELGGKTIVDPFRLWQQCEPRSLQHAHQRFVGQGFEAAHSASADVAATGRVLTGMLRSFNLDHHDWTAIAAVCDPQRPSWVGPSRHLRWEGPSIVLAFGKHTGTPLQELDRSYLRWIAEKDFPIHVTQICRKAMELAPDELLAWVRQQFGEPAPTAAPPFAASASGT